MLKNQQSEERRIQIDDIEVNYKIAGEGPAIFILHGWGSSSDSWTEVQKMLGEAGYNVIVLDLPGFGKTQAPLSRRSPKGEGGAEVWGIEEYSDFMYQYAKHLGVAKFTLIGHSFGGQIAIQFAVDHPEKLETLILIASAGVRRTPGIAKKLVMAVAKLMSFVLYIIPFKDLRMNVKNALYMLIRRRDYVKTQGIMREVFKKVITQDLTAKFANIRTRTLLIWGEKDELTPVQDAYLMNELIANSKLEIIPGAKHALNFEMPEKLCDFIVSFAKK